jgi:AraC family transcriptional regulator of adaptative response / DNA-3-methyladenine glycosylase II
VTTHGTPVSGLPGGLTHTFPDAAPDVGRPPADYLAFRGGDRDAFPLTDPSLRAALAARGLSESDAARWRPWRALAAMHLMVAS